MRRVALVNPPNHRYDRFELAPPLGLLVLAENALESGWVPRILDLALPAWDHLSEDPSRFYSVSADEILRTEPEVVAFTSMGVNSHVSLLLAQQVKARQPNVQVVVGGPHFSSIAKSVHRHFPFVDAVIMGEGEAAFREYLTSLGRVEYARAGQAIVATSPQVAPPLRHPDAAYSLISLDDYFAANPRRLLNYESGRGCVYKCSFCYSPGHYHSPRDTSIPTVVTDWTALIGRGAKHLFVVEDNFTNNPRRTLALCDAIAVQDLPITWNAYATIPQLTPQVIAALGRAKCRSLYLGIDAVAPSQRVTFNKRFYRDNGHLIALLGRLAEAGIGATCAFIIDLYRYDPNEIEHVFATAAVCATHAMPIRINVFTRYPSSALGSVPYSAFPSEAKVRALLDCPEVVCQNSLASTCPELFPFHSTEISETEWTTRLRMVRVAQVLIQQYPFDFLELCSAGQLLEPGISRLAATWTSVDAVPKQMWRHHVTELVEAL
jgi:hypothetical protein